MIKEEGLLKEVDVVKGEREMGMNDDIDIKV